MKICHHQYVFLGLAVLFACGVVSRAWAQGYAEGPAYGPAVAEGFYLDETPGFTTDSLLSEVVAAEPSPPLPSWGRIDAEVFSQVRETDLSQLARAQSLTNPTRDPAQLMARLDLFVRVGDRRRAERTIQAMGHTDLARDSVQANKIGTFLIAHGEWELTQRFLEACPRTQPDRTEEFLAHRTQETSPQSIERWLDVRERLYPNHDYWRRLSSSYFASLGTYKIHQDWLAAEIRAHPNDLSRVLPYIPPHVPSYFPFQKDPGTSPPIDWLPSVCRFDLAIENLALGLELRDSPNVARPFLERALELPITAADFRWLTTRQYYFPQNAQGKLVPEAIHRYIKTVLAKCYKAVGQWSDAQTMESEIAAQAPLKWVGPRSRKFRREDGLAGAAMGSQVCLCRHRLRKATFAPGWRAAMPTSSERSRSRQDRPSARRWNSPPRIPVRRVRTGFARCRPMSTFSASGRLRHQR